MSGNIFSVAANRPLRILLVCLALSFGNPASARDDTDIRGRELYETTCTPCHSLDAIEVTRNGRSGWEDTVHKMVTAGTQLNVEEMEIVIDYLTRRFGPGAELMRTGLLPPGSPLQTDGTVTSDNLTLPDGAGKELVQALCHMCHDLGRVVATRKSKEDWQRYTRNMLARGDLKPTPDQTQGIVSYLTRYFGLLH